MTRYRSLGLAGAAAIGLAALAWAVPSSSALGADASAVYVSNADGDTVSVIDPVTNAVVTDIAVGNEPRTLAGSPDRSTVYVPNRHSDTVSVIDTDTNTVVATIADPSFDEPYAVAFSADGTRAFVANKEGGGSSTGSVTVIATATRAVTGVIDDPCFASPEGIATSPTATRAYVVNRGADTVCVVDTASSSVIATVAVGGAPRDAVVTRDGSAVFVANNSGGTVTRIATADNSTTSIVTGGSPRNLALSADGSKVYVALQGASIARILVSDSSVQPITFTGMSSSYGVTVVPGTALGYVTDESNDQVAAFSTATDSETLGAGLPISGAFATPRAIASLGAAPPAPTTTTTTTEAPTSTTSTSTPSSTSTSTTVPPASSAARAVAAVATFTG